MSNIPLRLCFGELGVFMHAQPRKPQENRHRNETARSLRRRFSRLGHIISTTCRPTRKLSDIELQLARSFSSARCLPFSDWWPSSEHQFKNFHSSLQVLTPKPVDPCATVKL